ncbi:MAG: LCP family protein [Peptococcales bacterium]|jgi:LCP family protein required for cell wall assembly
MDELSRVKRQKVNSTHKRKPRRPKYGLYIMIALFCAMIVLGFQLADSWFAPMTNAETGEIIDEENPVVTEENDNRPINVLIIGTDERDNEPSRSDTLILAALFPQEKQVKLLSIPRDTRVNIPGKKGFEKASHAHAYGGADLAVETIEGLLDVNIDYYVKTNFQGFKNIIDILGGVTLNVEKRMYYPEEDIDLQAGLQTLNGYDALAYVRFRSDGMGDIGRVERQQKFLAALTDHVKSFATITKIPNLIKETTTHVKTDMGAKDILYFATKFMSIDKESIENTTLPGYPDTIDGVSYWVSNAKEVEKVMESMQSADGKSSAE